MDAWVMTLMSALPILGAAAFKFLTDRSKVRHQAEIDGSRTGIEAKKTDAEIAAELRDELREDLESARERIVRLEDDVDACIRDRDELRAQLNQLRLDLTRLQEQVRGRGPGDLKRLYDEEAAG